MAFSMRLQAVGDLLQRYGAAFRHAWRRRAEMAAVPRLAHEVQFLPAALALQDTPASPAPRAAMWLLIVFSGAALTWAVFGHLDVVATATGKIVPDDRTKTVQPFDTATVRAIHVTDGQSVKAGDILIELDATLAQADVDRIAGDLAAARLQVARGKGMLAALDGNQPPAIERPAGIDQAIFQEAQRLLLGQHREYLAKAARLEAEIARREAESRSTRALVVKLEQTVPIARRRAEDFKRLVSQKFVSEHGYLEREQVRIEQEADLANLRSRLKEIGASLREARGQLAEMAAETRRASLDSINEGQQKAAAWEQELLKAASRAKLMRLVAPVDGTVQQLAAHTVGGVVTPAQALMAIVPQDNPLEVEAFIENKDIGFIQAGQEAEIKIETFQYTRYGTIPARVASVSHDAISDEQRGLVYSARIRMERATMAVDGVPVNLSPGMAVSAEIKTGKRRIIEYFLSPLLQYGNESLRER